MHFDISIPHLKQCFENLFFFSMTFNTSRRSVTSHAFFQKKFFSCISDPPMPPIAFILI